MLSDDFSKPSREEIARAVYRQIRESDPIRYPALDS